MAHTEEIIGGHVVGGWPVAVRITTRPGVDGASYDLIDGDTLDLLTEGESFDAYPTEQQMRVILDEHDDGEAICCRFCQNRIHRNARRAGVIETGTNPYCCDDCWDERLR
ncbi:hypothetical protein ABZ897_51040 [Nonomuraea sp. NPDC046802]|uniref:hypothetical protein n=1 Tax=Nonomuraea sp. NPDC046802 TaxID=3154919 RepID=UPI0033E4DCF6